MDYQIYVPLVAHLIKQSVINVTKKHQKLGITICACLKDVVIMLEP